MSRAGEKAAETLMARTKSSRARRMTGTPSASDACSRSCTGARPCLQPLPPQRPRAHLNSGRSLPRGATWSAPSLIVGGSAAVRDGAGSAGVFPFGAGDSLRHPTPVWDEPSRAITLLFNRLPEARPAPAHCPPVPASPSVTVPAPCAILVPPRPSPEARSLARPLSRCRGQQPRCTPQHSRCVRGARRTRTGPQPGGGEPPGGVFSRVGARARDVGRALARRGCPAPRAPLACRDRTRRTAHAPTAYARWRNIK